MRVKVNGQQLEVVKSETLSELFKELEIDSVRVAAAEVNLSIIRRPDFSTFKLKDGDEIEIVNFVGGG